MGAVLRADVAELVLEPLAAAGPGFVDGGAHFAGEGLGGFGMDLVWARGLAFGLVGEERGLVVVRMRGVGAGKFDRGGGEDMGAKASLVALVGVSVMVSNLGDIGDEILTLSSGLTPSSAWEMESRGWVSGDTSRD